MKLTIYFSLIVIAFLISCRTTNQLPTEDGKEINISGRWNVSDATIIANKLRENFKASIFYVEEVLNPQEVAALYAVEVDFMNMEEPYDKSLGNKIEQAFIQLKKITVYSSNSPVENTLKMKVEMDSKIVDSYGETSIQYSLIAQLYDKQNNIVWTATESIKKYLSN